MFEPEIHIRKAERNIRCNISEKCYSGTFIASKPCRLHVVKFGLEAPTETFNNPTLSDTLSLSGVEPQKVDIVVASPAFDQDVLTLVS